ncbi:MAG: tRNA pseudouridine synthase A [candidate division Zixibacteria bacterium]|nr:tRNA pseudouridine synthase A [candidate division Zixibacteria bacterium]
MDRPVRNILLRLAFVGTNYAGWQRQQNDTSVQGAIEQAIKAVTGECVSLVGCSRTDAGVHAEDYVANFRTAAPIPADRFQPAIQTKLPRDIQILASKEVVLPEMAGLLVGMHDFSGFCVQKSLKDDNRCTIKDAAWRKIGKKLYFKITGDRFLHHMVRFLVGAQFEVATGRLTRGDFELILKNPTEKRALYTAPPDGLYLMRVKIR